MCCVNTSIICQNTLQNSILIVRYDPHTFSLMLYLYVVFIISHFGGGGGAVHCEMERFLGRFLISVFCSILSPVFSSLGCHKQIPISSGK